MKKQIYIMSQDIAMCQGLLSALYSNHVDIQFMQSIPETMDRYHTLRCDLIIIDMPDFEMESLRQLCFKRKEVPIPVLILHTGLSVEEKIRLYHNGAAVLLEKRGEIEICRAQVQALLRLRRGSEYSREPSAPLIFGPELIIDQSCRIVKIDGESLNLTRKEFDMLLYFAQNSEHILGFEQLYENIWGREPDCNKIGTVKTHISTLRKKLLERGKNYIWNQWGVGYRFSPPQLQEDS